MVEPVVVGVAPGEKLVVWSDSRGTIGRISSVGGVGIVGRGTADVRSAVRRAGISGLRVQRASVSTAMSGIVINFRARTVLACRIGFSGSFSPTAIGPLRASAGGNPFEIRQRPVQPFHIATYGLRVVGLTSIIMI